MERLTQQVLDGTTDQMMDDLVRQTEDGKADTVANLVTQAKGGGTQ
ncbi:hypothetical protein OG806_08010 [Streptomyces sp. NBC_00882]|nr:hypothetical protein OG806_08010 [Streptomyces sp. NBC_00882]WSZ56254.1 hypothetical protein OH824_06755 [Streptomyces canus]